MYSIICLPFEALSQASFHQISFSASISLHNDKEIKWIYHYGMHKKKMYRVSNPIFVPGKSELLENNFFRDFAFQSKRWKNPLELCFSVPILVLWPKLKFLFFTNQTTAHAEKHINMVEYYPSASTIIEKKIYINIYQVNDFWTSQTDISKNHKCDLFTALNNFTLCCEWNQ